MITEKQIKIARDHFVRASQEFGFAFLSPYVLADDLTAFGYIADYGSKNGVAISLVSPSDFRTDRRIVEWCQHNDCFYSFLNIDMLTGEYNPALFQEMLQDWGKH